MIEDIADTAPLVTEHTIPRHWCPKCKKMFEPVVPDALPKATFGHRLVVFSAWLHYGLGATIAQIISVLGHHLQFVLSEGGLIAAWHRFADIFYAWYDEISQHIKQVGVLHADETGWRLAGKTVWLWCFISSVATYYMIDRSRGSPSLSKFFKEAFDCILITVFGVPTMPSSVPAARHVCPISCASCKRLTIRIAQPSGSSFRKNWAVS